MFFGTNCFGNKNHPDNMMIKAKMEGSKLTHFKQASVSSIWGNSWHTRTSLESSHTEGQNAEQDIRFSGPFSKKT